MKIKQKFLKPLAYLLFAVVLLNSCDDSCKESRTYVKYTSLVKPLVDIRASFEVQAPVQLENPKKIYLYNDFLFVVEQYKGFQILDNSSPTNPVPLKYIQLDGCTDVAVSNNVIYANQGPDIVSLSFSDMSDISLVDRVEDVMNTHLAIDGSFTYGYSEEEVTEEVECGSVQLNNRSNRFNARRNGNISLESSTGGGGSSSGTGGSMARFSIIQGNIYVVDNNTITTIDIASSMVKKSTVNASRNIETLFGTDKYLFLGTTTGMFIYDRNDGNTPTYRSGFSHARGCDPVVVQGDYAYITLRGNNTCGVVDDELHVVDISNIDKPTLKSSHSMNSPYGLGVYGNTLLICDGIAGLRVFDKSNLNEILDNEIATISDVNAYDVIPLENMFILSTQDGIYQYDYTNPAKPIMLSRIYGY